MIVAAEIAFVCFTVSVDEPEVDPQLNGATPYAVLPIAVSTAASRSEVTAPAEALGACPEPIAVTVPVYVVASPVTAAPGTTFPAVSLY